MGGGVKTITRKGEGGGTFYMPSDANDDQFDNFLDANDQKEMFGYDKAVTVAEHITNLDQKLSMRFDEASVCRIVESLEQVRYW